MCKFDDIVLSDAVGTNSHLKSVLQRPGMVTMIGAAYCDISKLPACGGKNLSSRKRHGALLVSCAKTSEATISAKAKGGHFSVLLVNNSKDVLTTS